MPGWRRNITVKLATDSKPTVHCLTAEPRLTRDRLAVQPDGDAFAVTLPEHRLWTVLVFTLPAQ
jgi:hypothetical protein